MKKQALLGGIGVVVLVAILFFVFRTPNTEVEAPSTAETTTEETEVTATSTTQTTADPEVEAAMSETVVSEDTEKKNVTNTVIANVNELSFQQEGDLQDVEGGDAYGTARATFTNDEYTLQATFENLPALADDYFYEGWVVRRGADMSVISTGRVDEVNGVQQNIYRSAQDLTDHDFYVLTREPDDGDPAPAEHVVEGVMMSLEGAEASEAREEAEQAQVASTPAREGQYVDYDEARLADAADGQVVLFFHAAWCPTCTVVDADITAKSEDIPNGMTILKVDYDSQRDLRNKYGVTYQHTFVQVDAQGNELKKWSGGDLDKIIERAI